MQLALSWFSYIEYCLYRLLYFYLIRIHFSFIIGKSPPPPLPFVNVTHLYSMSQCNLSSGYTVFPYPTPLLFVPERPPTKYRSYLAGLCAFFLIGQFSFFGGTIYFRCKNGTFQINPDGRMVTLYDQSNTTSAELGFPAIERLIILFTSYPIRLWQTLSPTVLQHNLIMFTQCH